MGPGDGGPADCVVDWLTDDVERLQALQAARVAAATGRTRAAPIRTATQTEGLITRGAR